MSSATASLVSSSAAVSSAIAAFSTTGVSVAAAASAIHTAVSAGSSVNASATAAAAVSAVSASVSPASSGCLNISSKFCSPSGTTRSGVCAASVASRPNGNLNFISWRQCQRIYDGIATSAAATVAAYAADASTASAALAYDLELVASHTARNGECAGTCESDAFYATLAAAFQ